MNVFPLTPPVPVHTPPVGVAVSNTVVSVRHTRIGTLVKIMFGPGLTVIVNVLTGPAQLMPLVIVANTEIVAVTGEVVGFTAVNDGRLPTPLGARPIDVLLLVHVKNAPATLLPNVIADVSDPLHTVKLLTTFTVGVGFTVIVKLMLAAAPHEAALLVTVIVPLIGTPVVLVPVNDGMLPVPPAARPIAVLVLVQV